MRLDELVASPAPEGNRVVLSWRNPDPSAAPGARVVRRAGAFPTTPTPATTSAGVVVADSDGDPKSIDALADGRLQVVDDDVAEGTHYYWVFPYAGAGPSYDLDPTNRVAAAATAPYGFTERLASLLPALYHRFDTAAPAASLDPAVVAAMASEHRECGQLRRFLELPGGQLDQLYSDIRSLLDLHDIARVDGHLLSLLAEWIGWSTDHRLGYVEQRAEIRDAPALYAAVGTVPALEATVRRIAGWETRTKEFVDNVFLVGHPERRTLWLATREAGEWVLPTAPLSFDDAPHGRPVAVRDGAGSLRLVYHVRRGGRFEIHAKRHTTGGGWEPSEPVVARAGVHRDPAVAQQGAVTWVFWSVYDADTGTWRIEYRTSGPSGWGAVATFRVDDEDTTGRRAPASTVDDTGALWLFWLEEDSGRWRLRYNRFTAAPWAPSPAGALNFPDDGGDDPRVESDVFVFSRPPQASDPTSPFRQTGVLWARREPTGPEQTRWRVVARFKDGLAVDDMSDWGATVALPALTAHRSDREPAAHVAGDGTVTVVFSSTRDGGWSVFEVPLELDPIAWGAPVGITAPPYSERGPLPVALTASGDLDALCFRSNRSLVYRSARYRATVTTDRRYSGSTTARSTDAVKHGLRGDYDDFGAYTYEAGRTDADRYARDAVGLFVDHGGADPATVAHEAARLRRVLPEFTPATDRTLVIDPTAPA